jgi:Holliday junction resolvase
MANKSKAKGNGYERELVDFFKKRGIKSKRAWGSNGQALGMHEEVDVALELDDRVYKLQAKRRKKISDYLKPSEHVDFQVLRADREDSLVVMRIEDFAKFINMEKYIDEINGY